jgi:hypothetical protein
MDVFYEAWAKKFLIKKMIKHYTIYEALAVAGNDCISEHICLKK